jgi:hypothetical protein
MIEFYYKTIFYILFVIVIILSVVLLTRNNLNLKLEGFFTTTTSVTSVKQKDSSGELLNQLEFSSSTGSEATPHNIFLVIEKNEIQIPNSITLTNNKIIKLGKLTGQNRVTLLKNNILKNEISVKNTINSVDYASYKFSFEYIYDKKKAADVDETATNRSTLLDAKILYLQELLETEKDTYGFDSVLKDLETRLLLEIQNTNADNNEITKLKNDISRISKEKRAKRIELYELDIKKIKDDINKKITKKNELTTTGDTKIKAEKIIDTDINTLSAKLKTAQEKLSKFKSYYDGEDFLKGLVEANPNVVREKKLNNMIDKKTIKDLGKYVTSFVALQTSIASKIDTLDRKLEAADIEDKQRFYGDTKEKSIYNKNFLNIKNVVFSKYFFDEYTQKKKEGKVTGKHKDAYLTLIKSEKNMTRSKDNVFEFEDNLYYIKLDNGFLKYNSIDNYEVCNIDIEKLSVLPENKYGFCQTPEKYGVFKNDNNENSYKLNLGKFQKTISNKKQIVSIGVFPWAVAANAYKDRIIKIGEKTFKITINTNTNGIDTKLTLILDDEYISGDTNVILLSEWPSYQKMVQEFPTNIPLTENCIDDRSYLFSLIKIYNIVQLEFYTKLRPDKKTTDAINDINTKMYAESQPLFYLIAPFNYNLQFVSIDITDNEEKLLSIDYANANNNSKLYFFLSDEYDFGDNDEMIDHIRESITGCEKKRCS